MQDTNILYQFFPRSMGLTETMEDVVNVFKEVEDKISSSTNDLRSDDVLSIVRPGLENRLLRGTKQEGRRENQSSCSFRIQQQYRQTFLCRRH